MVNYEEILNLKIDNDDFSDDLTIKGYLRLLLATLWNEGESFSGKRPFGNSGWEYDLYLPLVKAGVVVGELDEDGYIDSIDEQAANALVFNLIEEIFNGE